MNRIPGIVILAGVIGLSGTVNSIAQEQNVDAVSAFFAAYNDHDAQRMAELADDQIRWMSVAGEKITILSRGKSDLVSTVQGYFDSMPTTRSEAHEIRRNGNFVTMVEQAHWKRGGQPESHCAIAVYELKGALILNVWYFRSQPCDTGASP